MIASQPEGFRKCKPRDKEKHSLVRAVDVINGAGGIAGEEVLEDTTVGRVGHCESGRV